MNVFIHSVVLLFIVRAGGVELLRHRDFNIIENGTEWKPDGMVGTESNDKFANEMNSTSYMTVNHYYCAAEEIEDPVTILYGTQSWTFPVQDVNLKLSYPSADSESIFSSEDDGYIITGFKVVLYIDGKETKGYIMNGGVLQESIVLSFVSQYATSLSYEFWLYGMLKDKSGKYTEMTTRYLVCK